MNDMPAKQDQQPAEDPPTLRRQPPPASATQCVFSIPPDQWDAIGTEVDRLRGAGLIARPSVARTIGQEVDRFIIDHGDRCLQCGRQVAEAQSACSTPPEDQPGKSASTNCTSPTQAPPPEAPYDGLVLERDRLKAHVEQCGSCFALIEQTRRAEQADVGLAEARETIRSLNRRCQSAEAALNERQEDWNKRSTDKQRNHYYTRYTEAEARLSAAQRVADEWLHRANETHGQLCADCLVECADELAALLAPPRDPEGKK